MHDARLPCLDNVHGLIHFQKAKGLPLQTRRIVSGFLAYAAVAGIGELKASFVLADA